MENKAKTPLTKYLLENFNNVSSYKLDKYIGLTAIVAGIFSVEAQLLAKSYCSNLLFIAFLFMYACMITHMLFRKNINQKEIISPYKQLFIINLLIALFWDTSVWNRMNTISSVNFPIMIMGLLIWNISTLGLGIRIYIIRKEKMLEKCKNFLLENHYILMLLFMVCIFFIPCFSYWFKSDSNVYYTDIVMKQGNWDFTVGSALSGFTLGGHLCYGYSFFLTIGQSLFPDNGTGIRLVTLLLYLVTIFLFSKILKMQFPSGGKLENVLVTGVFAFTPIVFGILSETNIDFPLLCFWTWFVYCHLSGKQILRLFTGLLTCFSKELGVLFIAGFFVSNYVYDLFCIKGKSGISQKIDSIFQAIRLSDFFTCFSCVFLFFICSIFSKEGWTARTITAPQEIAGNLENTVQFSWTYILIKLKQIFVLNFQWLFLIIAAVFLILLLLRRIKLNITQMGFTLFVLFGGFLCFNFFYFTWPHARYLQIGSFFFCTFLGYSSRLIFENKKILNICLGVILGIHIISCFVLIDPLSYLCFKNINIGNKKIISLTEYSTLPDTGALMFTEKENPRVDLNNHILRDFVQYNREYTHLEQLIEKMFAEMNYNEEIAVFIPPLFPVLDDDKDTENLNTKYTYDNIFGFARENAYWNPKSRNIYYHANGSANPNEVKINWLTQNDINTKTFGKYRQVVYLDFPYQTKWNKKNFLKKCKIKKTIKKKYFGWTLEAHYIIPNGEEEK